MNINNILICMLWPTVHCWIFSGLNEAYTAVDEFLNHFQKNVKFIGQGLLKLHNFIEDTVEEDCSFNCSEGIAAG